MAHRRLQLETAAYDTLTNRTLASEGYADAILGPGAIGWVGQILLFGIAVGLVIDYVKTEMYERDPKWRKALLWAVMVVTMAQAA